ncbi:hypothetical protein [Azospirillum sp.]|uniref:hypothetical protein n=1 Tax=Azospirillum sp. TaxID=34012 RepID=UPI003D72C32C
MSGHAPMRSHVDQRLRQLLESDAPNEKRSYDLLLLGAAYRMEILKAVLVERTQRVVAGGPFAGMRLLDEVSDGCYLPKLMGTYEGALHLHFDAACTRGYDAVVNIGCAEGYYAVGFARRLPQAQVHAYDIDPNARRLCANMARLNGVGERLHIADRFDGAMFAGFAGKRTLVVCDIEGGEVDLIRPDLFPALRGMDLIMELHDWGGNPASTIVPPRFAATHEVVVLDGRSRAGRLPDALSTLSELDQMVVTWEGRREQTPWAVMTARA